MAVDKILVRELQLYSENDQACYKKLMAINETHKELMGKLIVENEELKKDNKRLAKQIDDYFNAR